MTYEDMETLHVYERIARGLRLGIQQGRYAPGDTLPDMRELARRFKCSTQPVRDAISILAQEGLVVVRPRSGTYVAEPGDSAAE